jgi:phosphoribosylamine-glycine ligase
VLEFNGRFGNPETLVLMALLESDLVEAMLACSDGRLTPSHVQIADGAAVAVMLASPNYPAETFPVGLPISGTRSGKRALPNVNLFHHGTACANGRLVTSRGRVLAVTATAHDLPGALNRAYQAVGQSQLCRSAVPPGHWRQAPPAKAAGSQLAGEAGGLGNGRLTPYSPQRKEWGADKKTG